MVKIFGNLVAKFYGIKLMSKSTYKNLLTALLIMTFSSFISTANTEIVKNDKIPVKVVIVTMFENGEIQGDRPGEYQFWIERNELDKTFSFPLGEYDIHMNDDGVLAICVGGGIPNATSSIMALGLDDRFNLSKAYWLIAGIAGGDPEDISLGSAAWAKHIVDGDLVYEIDGREIPKDWRYGMVPLGGKKPAEKPEDIYTGWTLNTISFSLNSSLIEWAYNLTKNISLNDTDEMKLFRGNFKNYPNARKKPFVTVGDTLSASTYWHGEHLNRWANDWVKLYAGSDANFMTTNMEDSGTMTALSRLSRINKVDINRVMVLRTISNYSMAPENKPSSWSLTAPYPNQGIPALEAAHRVGNTVVEEIIKNWGKYSIKIP